MDTAPRPPTSSARRAARDLLAFAPTALLLCAMGGLSPTATLALPGLLSVLSSRGGRMAPVRPCAVAAGLALALGQPPNVLGAAALALGLLSWIAAAVPRTARLARLRRPALARALHTAAGAGLVIAAARLAWSTAAPAPTTWLLALGPVPQGPLLPAASDLGPALLLVLAELASRPPPARDDPPARSGLGLGLTNVASGLLGGAPVALGPTRPTDASGRLAGWPLVLAGVGAGQLLVIALHAPPRSALALALAALGVATATSGSARRPP